MSDTIGEIAIPADNEGFCLLQCPFCGEFFKLTPSDFEAEDVIEIWCPSCGLKGENYFTDDAIRLALKKTKNYAMDLIFNKMKKWEKEFSGGFVTFKAGKQPAHEEEKRLMYGVEVLELVKYPCCKKEAKIKPIYKICGSYCPFCGVRYDEHR